MKTQPLTPTAELHLVVSRNREGLRVSTIALAMMLLDLEGLMDRSAALKLALATANGMARTAPMKEEAIDDPSEAMIKTQHEVIMIDHK
jgi:hypothetical protein